MDAAEHALAEAEKKHGRDSADVVSALEKLADLYIRDGLWGKAELLYKRVTDILGQGSEHKSLLVAHSKLAEIYRSEASRMKLKRCI